MATAVHADSGTDATDLPLVVRAAVFLGVVQAVCVLLVSVINKRLTGTADIALTGVVVAVGTAFTIFFPAMRTRPRTIEGIAGAAGIGLGAALVFLVIDVSLLQPIGTYTNRWREIGGDSNWWYHPTWWIVGSYLPWLGAWILANQASRRGEPSLPVAIGLVALLASAIGTAAAMLHFPGASFNVATFAVAVLPALTLGTWISGLGAPRH